MKQACAEYALEQEKALNQAKKDKKEEKKAKKETKEAKLAEGNISYWNELLSTNLWTNKVHF